MIVDLTEQEVQFIAGTLASVTVSLTWEQSKQRNALIDSIMEKFKASTSKELKQN